MTRRRRRARPPVLETQLRRELGLAHEQLELPAPAPAGATNVSENQSREGATPPSRRTS